MHNKCIISHKNVNPIFMDLPSLDLLGKILNVVKGLLVSVKIQMLKMCLIISGKSTDPKFMSISSKYVMPCLACHNFIRTKYSL